MTLALFPRSVFSFSQTLCLSFITLDPFPAVFLSVCFSFVLWLLSGFPLQPQQQRPIVPEAVSREPCGCLTCCLLFPLCGSPAGKCCCCPGFTVISVLSRLLTVFTAEPKFEMRYACYSPSGLLVHLQHVDVRLNLSGQIYSRKCIVYVCVLSELVLESIFKWPLREIPQRRVFLVLHFLLPSQGFLRQRIGVRVQSTDSFCFWPLQSLKLG